MANTPTINLFGRVGITVGDERISPFRTRHGAMLLTYLSLHAGEPVSRTQLVELLWPMSQEGSTRNRLSVTTYHLRTALKPYIPEIDDVIISARDTITLVPDNVQIDYLEFQRTVALFCSVG